MYDSDLRKANLNMDDDTVDTIAMAEIVRQHQGSFEMEVTCGGEADLHHHKRNCEKNPGHDQFVPVGDFNLEHLPPEYQDPDIVDLVKAQADITVRVSVRYISDKRPDFWLDGKTPYPFAANRIKYKNRISRTGTGFVNISGTFSEMVGPSCTCYTCKTTGERRTVGGTFSILTATHVVFDELEGRTAKCHLFYDTSDAALTDLHVLTEPRYVKADMKLDRTDLGYVTHDKDLFDRLYRARLHFVELRQRLYKKYRNISYSSLVRTPKYDSFNTTVDTEHKLIVITSHPHGCSKQVTVGQWVDKEDFYDTYDNAQFIYNTKTCPGSSGALLFALGSCPRQDSLSTILHKGACKEPGLNCSGIGLDYTEMEIIIPLDKLYLFTGRRGVAVREWLEREADVFMVNIIDEELPATCDKVMLVYGTPKKCQRTKQLVLDLISGKRHLLFHKIAKGHYTCCTTSATRQVVGRIIDTGWFVIKRILADTANAVFTMLILPVFAVCTVYDYFFARKQDPGGRDTHDTRNGDDSPTTHGSEKEEIGRKAVKSAEVTDKEDRRKDEKDFKSD